jgi:hypothetical protein
MEEQHVGNIFEHCSPWPVRSLRKCALMVLLIEKKTVIGLKAGCKSRAFFPHIFH